VVAPSLDYSATDRYCAEELLILLINFMKKMKSEQAVLPNPCLEEEEEEEEEDRPFPQNEQTAQIGGLGT
jgi:hypothetical protein